MAGDPGFDRFTFLGTAKTRFATVKQAVMAWQPESCREFMTPALFASWSDHMVALQQQQVRNVFEDLQVGDPLVLWASPGPGLQHVAVQLNAMAVHFAFSEATRQLLFGDMKQMHGFTEYWTFSRPAGSLTGPVASASRCASCGAPLPAGAAVCPYCKAAVVPAGGDWLVSRMDEDLVWSDD